MKVGDIIKLPHGTTMHWKLKADFAVLIEKLPRVDELEYDWRVFVDGHFIELGRQIEYSAEVVSANW